MWSTTACTEGLNFQLLSVMESLMVRPLSCGVVLIVHHESGECNGEGLHIVSGVKEGGFCVGNDIKTATYISLEVG